MDNTEKSKSDPKILYAYINGQNTRKEHVILLIEPSKKHLTDKNEIVERLNWQNVGQLNRCDKSLSLQAFNSRSEK